MPVVADRLPVSKHENNLTPYLRHNAARLDGFEEFMIIFDW